MLPVETEPTASGSGAKAGRRAANLTIAAFVLLVLFGGMNAIGVRYTVLELPPFWGAGLRFGAASVLLAVAMLAMRLPMPRGRALVGVILYGLLNFAGTYAFIYWGFRYVQPGMAQVLLSLVPLLTLFFAVLHGLESFRWRGLLGALTAIAGVAVGFQVQTASNVPPPALLAIIAGAACMAESGVIVKQFPRVHPVTLSALSMALGTVVLLALSILVGETQQLPTRPETWAAVAYMVFFGSIAVFMLFLYIVPRLPISTVSYHFVLLPFVTVSASAWLTGEQITLPLVLGGGLVLLGVWVGAISQSPIEPPPDAHTA
ncbi:MAG TPA: EamA family transporter [Chloroflexia bacterium]|nr:EamA family transporter [Chloroflexia bacterium]